MTILTYFYLFLLKTSCWFFLSACMHACRSLIERYMLTESIYIFSYCLNGCNFLHLLKIMSCPVKQTKLLFIIFFYSCRDSKAPSIESWYNLGLPYALPSSVVKCEKMINKFKSLHVFHFFPHWNCCFTVYYSNFPYKGSYFPLVKSYGRFGY